MRKKRIGLFAGIFFLVVGVSVVPMALAQPEGGGEEESRYPDRLKAGDTIPEMKFKEIHGMTLMNTNFDTWIVVYSFADRISQKELQKIIGPAGIEVVMAHPDLKIAYFSIADLTLVPNLLRELVTPVLELISENNNSRLEDAYRTWRVPLKEERSRFYMITDFTGEHLHTFGLKDAREWHSFVTYKKKVYAVFDASHPPYVDNYLPVFDKLSKIIPAKEKIPPPPKGK